MGGRLACMTTDSYRWLPRSLASYYRAIELEEHQPPPFARLRKRVAQSRIAAITTGGVHLKDDRSFDLDRERQQPTWGDPSFRVLPADVATSDIAISHLHYNPDDALADLDVVLPVPLLRKLVGEGVVGDVTRRHYSFMGFQLDPRSLLVDHLPKVIAMLREDHADAVVLTPA